jgi:Bcr/CflA subfamily drug resistance transporter
MRRNLVLFLCILLITLGQFIDIYLPSMPSMAVDLNTSVSIIQLSITLAMIAFGFVFVYGPLSDYYGRRTVALLGISIFILGSIICILAPNIYVLLVGRVLQGGIGIACAGAVAPAAVRDIFTGQKLVRAYAYVSMFLAITPFIAPVIGGYLQHYIGWRANFGFLLLYACIIFLLFLKWFPETNSYVKQVNIVPKIIVKNYLHVLTNRKFLGFILCLVLVFSGEIAYAIVAPFLLQTKLGITPVQNGWLILFTVSGFLTGSFLSSHFSSRTNIKKPISMGMACITIGSLVMLLFALMGYMSVILLVVPMLIYMLGAGLIYSNCIAGCMGLFPEKAGIASASVSGLQIAGAGLFNVIVSHLHVNNQLPLAGILSILSLSTILVFYVLVELKV